MMVLLLKLSEFLAYAAGSVASVRLHTEAALSNGIAGALDLLKQ